MTKVATYLTEAARKELIAFCEAELREEFDADAYANGLEDEHDFSYDAHFEIRGIHTKSGNPATISFNLETECVWQDID